MFSINVKLKLALTVLLIGCGIWWIAAFGFWYGFFFLLIGIGLLVSYIMLGTIQTSAQLLQLEQFDAAEKRLAWTWKPNWLYKTNRAMFYILKGGLAMNRQNFNEAEEYFKTAESIDLPTDDEKAMVQLQLASINAQKNKWNAAKRYYMNLKKLKVTQPQIKAQIAQFDMAFKNRGQLKHQQGGGRRGQQVMQLGKSKRRSPKMR